MYRKALAFFFCLCFISPSIKSARGQDLTSISLRRFKIYTGGLRFSRVGDTTSCPIPHETPEQEHLRLRRAVVDFAHPFKKTPMVIYSLTLVDINKDYHQRYKARLMETTKANFTIEFRVWCDTFVYRAELQYWVFGDRFGEVFEQPLDATEVMK